MFILPKKHLGKKQRSIRSERRAAKTFGGRVQPASGAINRFDLKCDVKSEKFLVDDKITGRGSYSISLKLWREIKNHAFRNRRHPAMRVEFEGGDTLYIVNEITFQALLKNEI